MCPVCITTTAMMLAGATSTGRLTVLAVKKLNANRGAKSANPTTESKGDRDDSAKSRIAR